LAEPKAHSIRLRPNPNQRLNAGIRYLRPADVFFGRGHVVLAERDRKIEIARTNRKKQNRESTAAANVN
jgi:hypothetical protein